MYQNVLRSLGVIIILLLSNKAGNQVNLDFFDKLKRSICHTPKEGNIGIILFLYFFTKNYSITFLLFFKSKFNSNNL